MPTDLSADLWQPYGVLPTQIDIHVFVEAGPARRGWQAFSHYDCRPANTRAVGARGQMSPERMSSRSVTWHSKITFGHLLMCVID
jgi:hypothetical protein